MIYKYQCPACGKKVYKKGRCSECMMLPRVKGLKKKAKKKRPTLGESFKRYGW